MRPEHKLSVVLYWHMHQPEYRNLASGEFAQPWAYLHAIKDYVDMAAHLEANPAAKAVINFAPVLLAQLDDYERQIDAALSGGPVVRDPLLAALDASVFPVAGDQRNALLKACLRAHPQHMIKRHADYARLVDMARLVVADAATGPYLTNQFMADLVTWYHLAWLGETVRRDDPEVKRLLEQGREFSLPQRRELLSIIGRLIAGLRGRYRRLADAGQVELTTSPYAHPIIPLLLEFTSAHEATPGLALPQTRHYPGGHERVMAQLARGRECFESYFGLTAAGCWPSEGAVSGPALKLIADAGFRWSATGANVLRNSLTAAGKPQEIYQPYSVGGDDFWLFARDDELSDLIGFTYATWRCEDAIGDLEQRLVAIADQRAERPRIVSIIMDGENAWEHYPANAYYFLSRLYERLARHPRLILTTYAEARARLEAVPLETIVAGSWVYGNLTTWIGDKDKNRAWDILSEGKRCCDEQLAAGRVAAAGNAAPWNEQLMVCEGSDWFWWLGDYNPAESVRDFEYLFRVHMGNLYRVLGAVPPDYLVETMAVGRGMPFHGGVMRPGQAEAATEPADGGS